jgi:Lar family restriction alleviation protein
MSAVALRACPFCGSADVTLDLIDTETWTVCCNECKTIGPHEWGECPVDAIRKWNERK